MSPADPHERFQDRRIPLSPAEDAELERLITAFASEMGSKVKGTHVGRALFGMFMDADGDVDLADLARFQLTFVGP